MRVVVLVVAVVVKVIRVNIVRVPKVKIKMMIRLCKLFPLENLLLLIRVETRALLIKRF